MDDGGSDDGDDNSDLRVSKAPWREYKTYDYFDENYENYDDNRYLRCSNTPWSEDDWFQLFAL